MRKSERRRQKKNRPQELNNFTVNILKQIKRKVIVQCAWFVYEFSGIPNTLNFICFMCESKLICLKQQNKANERNSKFIVYHKPRADAQQGGQ